MSIAIIFNHKEPAAWAERMRELLPGELIEIYPDIEDSSEVEFAICWKPDHGVLDTFPALKVIQSTGAAIDHITNTQTIAEGVQLTRMVDHRLTTDMFEFAMAATLDYLKNLGIYQTLAKHAKWQPSAYKSIPDTKVAILGLGKIGSYVAAQFSQLGFKVSGWSRTKKQIENVSTENGTDGLTSVLSGADVLINILPFTSATENIINKKNLSLLRKDACLINIGRGEHLVEQDLLSLLDSDHIAKAYLDVFREEPLPDDHPFWNHEKIVVTPHIAALTNLHTATLLIAENFKRYQKGEEVLHAVVLDKGY